MLFILCVKKKKEMDYALFKMFNKSSADEVVKKCVGKLFCSGFDMCLFCLKYKYDVAIVIKD